MSDHFWKRLLPRGLTKLPIFAILIPPAQYSSFFSKNMQILYHTGFPFVKIMGSHILLGATWGTSWVFWVLGYLFAFRAGGRQHNSSEKIEKRSTPCDENGCTKLKPSRNKNMGEKSHVNMFSIVIRMCVIYFLLSIIFIFH